MHPGYVAVLLAMLVVAGCQSRAGIPVNTQQTLVMESSVPAEGITATPPEVIHSGGQSVATSELYNNSKKSVTVNYRYYWYDTKGLEIHPPECPLTLVIPAQSRVKVASVTQVSGASKVRLYLYL